MLARDQQKMFEPHFTNGGALTCDLIFIKGFPLDAVAHGETAIAAVIGAQVREIKWNVEAYRVAKTLAGKALSALRHRFKVRAGRRREQGHQVLTGQMTGIQGTLHVSRRFAVDTQGDIVPVELTPAFGKRAHERASRKPVSGLVACA